MAIRASRKPAIAFTGRAVGRTDNERLKRVFLVQYARFQRPLHPGRLYGNRPGRGRRPEWT
jgi:hypothetical protein